MLQHALEQSCFNLQMKKQRFCSAITAITCRKTAISHRKTAISHMKTAITHRKLVSHIENCLWLVGVCWLHVCWSGVVLTLRSSSPHSLRLPRPRCQDRRPLVSVCPPSSSRQLSLVCLCTPAPPSPARPTYPAPAALCRHLLDTSLCC